MTSNTLSDCKLLPKNRCARDAFVSLVDCLLMPVVIGVVMRLRVDVVGGVCLVAPRISENS